MSKEYCKATLELLDVNELKDIATNWDIRKISNAKSTLVNQIYHHNRNQKSTGIISFSKQCTVLSDAACLHHYCQQHQQSRFIPADGYNDKITPTKFFRAPYSTCWFVAGCQFLAAIDWSPHYYKLNNSSKNQIFNQIFNCIKLAKFDVSNDTFKSAPAAHTFIQTFKTDLIATETDWNMLQEQDAREFIVAFLGNLDFSSKNTPKAFFPKKTKTTQIQKHVIQFMKQELSITQLNIIHCEDCQHEYKGGDNNAEQQENIVHIGFPENEHKNQNIQRLLDHHQRVEKMQEDHRCSNCNVKGKTTKQIVFDRAPLFLILELKRNVVISIHPYQTRKITNHVYLNRFIKIKTLQGVRKYKLVATLDHHGGSDDYGHWTCRRSIDKKLFDCDDDDPQRVTSFDGKKAGLLLYVRVTEPATQRPTKSKQNIGDKRKNMSTDSSSSTQSPTKRRKVTNNSPQKPRSSNILNTKEKQPSLKVTGKKRKTEIEMHSTKAPPSKKKRLTVTPKKSRKRKSKPVRFNHGNKRQKLNFQHSNNPSQTPHEMLKCPHCKKYFKGSYGIYAHIGRKHKICMHCKNTFKNQKALKTHIGMKHHKAVQKVCQHCGMKFCKQHELNKHLQETSEATTSQPLACPHCEQRFHHQQGIKVHVGKMHKSEAEMRSNETNFDFTTATHFPSWQEIKDHRHKNPHYNAAGFLKMIGTNVKDSRIQPNDISFTVDKEQLMEDWNKNMKHNVSIGTCATCGRQIPLTEGQHHALRSSSRLLQCCRADEESLPSKDESLYKYLHLVEINNDIYKLCEKGIKKEKDEITVCDKCHGNLIYAARSKKPPINTFAHYDVGKMPKLKKLTFGEKLAMSKVIVFVPQIQFKPIHGKSNQGIKGHAFGIRASQDEILNSLVRILPRQDLAEVIQISFCGDKQMWPIAKEILKKGDLHIRIDVIMIWLRWIKRLGNPEFKDVIIPATKEKEKEAQKMLEESIDALLDAALQTSSAKVDSLMKNARSEILDEQEGLNENIDQNACLIKKTLITEDIHSEEPMQTILKKIKQKLSDGKEHQPQNAKIKKTIHAELINEYTQNHRLLSAGFPYLFPFGLSKDVMGTATIPKIMRETWMLFYDHRFAEELHLIFLLFDQQRRHDNNAAVAYKIKTAGTREQQFIKIVNDEDFLQNVQTAINEPKSKMSTNIKQTIEPLIKIVGRTVPWTPYERNDTLGKLYSLTHFFGIGTHFITISPSMRNNVMALRMCLQNATQKFEVPTITVRSQMITQNPVAATYIFYYLMDKFFELIVKLPLNTFNGRNMNYDALIEQETSGNCGAFGHVTGHFGILEEQTGGSLHYHGMLFGPWNVRMFQQWCHEGKAAKMFQQLIDSHITCRIPQHLKVKHTQQQSGTKCEKMDVDEIKENSNTTHRKVDKRNLLRPYPEASEIEADAARLASVINHHRHSATCWKPGRTKCRLAMPQPQADHTFFTEICADENGEPIRKYPQTESHEEVISKPPLRGHNAFSVKDERIIVSRLARTDAFEELQVEINPITTALLRCNTSPQVLITESQARAAIYYIAQYMSKNPFPLENVMALILQAEQEWRKYGSTASDKDAADRKAKNMLQKLLNKSGLLEVSDQQATAAVMGYNSFISSHKFEFVDPWNAVVKHRKLYDEVDDEDDEDVEELLANLELDSKSQKAISISSLERYLSRGTELRMYSMYMYTLMIGHRKPLKKKNTTKRGRPENPTFPYVPNSKAAKCFEQIMKSHPTIPRIAGKQPPPYPGDKPSSDQSISKIIQWTNKAKTFVQFFSLLFLPFDEHLKIMKPYDQILPWNDSTSWDNFWKIFNEFENAKNFYHRSVWFIFQNMVDNLRQRTHERTLVMKWRFANAHCMTKTQQRDASKNLTEQESDEISEDVDDLEALQITIQRIRDKYGSDVFLSRAQIERRKATAYLNKQIDTYRTLKGPDPSPGLRAKRFHKYTCQECESMSDMMWSVDDAQPKESDKVEFKADDQIEFNAKDYIILKPFQEKAVNQLKQMKLDANGDEQIKPGQLLAFIQGIPGSGKTATAKMLAQKLGLSVIFSGTTSTAAAQLKTDTINKILRLGLNLANFKETTISYQKKQQIMQAFEKVQLLIIDEISMLTAVTLAKINMYLQKALESEYLFGGIDIILIGDMFQFPPVQNTLSKPALYQAAVMLGLGLNMPNEAYRTGAQLFTKFRMVILDGQVRASREFNKWLGQLRDLTVEHPITDDWLSKLTTLSDQDFQSRQINWMETTIVVSGNAERYKFICEKIKDFGLKHKQPILRWICPVKVGGKQFEIPTFDPENVYDQLIKYFVRGAKCVLTEGINTKLGLGKGSQGIYLDVVWKRTEDSINLAHLTPGQITNVTQPDYIVIQIHDKIIAIKPKSTTFEDVNHNKRTYLAHECELSDAVTFHKVQGKTMESVILSLNSTSTVSRKIHRVTLQSIYVGCSRVHDHQHLRVFPLSTADKEYLKALKWDPYLKMFFQNFDKQGKWKPNGLKKHRTDFVESVKLELGMIRLSELTLKELRKYARDLDVIVPNKAKANKPDYIESLKQSHAEGMKLLKHNDGHLLKVQRSKLLTDLQGQNMNKMSLPQLRKYAKRLNIENCLNKGKTELQQELEEIKQRQSIIIDDEHDIDMLQTATDADQAAMDVEDFDEDLIDFQEECKMDVMDTDEETLMMTQDSNEVDNNFCFIEVEENQVNDLISTLENVMDLDDD